MDVSGSRIEYIPGQGYFGYLPGSDKPALRWGDEFWAMMKEKAAQNAANQVKTPVLPNGPGRYDPVALETFERRKLTKQELSALAAELAEKYDPSNMTQAEMDSFMDDLVAEGLLSEDELGVLGYHGFTVLWSPFEGDGMTGWGGCDTLDTSNPEWDTYYSRYGSPTCLQNCNGDALAYTKLMSFYKNPAGSDAFVKYAQTKRGGYAIMANILEAVQRKRQALGLGGEDDSTSSACANSGLNSGLTWAEAMTRWKDASNSGDSLDEKVEDVRSDMYAALDNVLEASMERRRLALARGLA